MCVLFDQPQYVASCNGNEELEAIQTGDDALLDVQFEYGLFAGERFFICEMRQPLNTDEAMVAFKHALALVKEFGDEVLPRVGLVRPLRGHGWLGIGLSCDRLRVVQMVGIDGTRTEEDALGALTLALFEFDRGMAQ